jgi:hypothetical protein
MRRFLEGHLPRQLAELISADNEFACQAIDMAQAGLGRDDTVQPAGLYRCVDETALAS